LCCGVYDGLWFRPWNGCVRDHDLFFGRTPLPAGPKINNTRQKITKPPTPGEVFPSRVTQERESRRWSKQDLTESLERIGHPLDRMAVTRLEQGARKAPIDDFLCFAAALEVPPWHLLVPDELDAPMRVGSTVATAGAVGAWLVGDWPLPFPGADAAHWQWGMGSLGRYPEAQVLRELVNAAERAETEADRLAVARAGIQVLEGHAAVLEIAVGQDT
jgi:transcriptional regulator with XRE-family HTH domain